MKRLFLLLIPILLCSCDSRNITYSKEVAFENHWSYDEPLIFEFSIPDTTAAYDLVLEIDHDSEYSFQNFYTRFTTSYPDGKVVNDIVSMELADKYGQWMGECNSDHCVTEILLSGNTLFRTSDTHKIEIAQYTRTPLLAGIRNIDFLLIQKQK